MAEKNKNYYEKAEQRHARFLQILQRDDVEDGLKRQIFAPKIELMQVDRLERLEQLIMTALFHLKKEGDDS
jgi:hypothetical protein